MLHVDDSFLGFLSCGWSIAENLFWNKDKEVSGADLCGWSIVEKKIGRKVDDEEHGLPQQRSSVDGVHLFNGLHDGMYTSFILRRPCFKSVR
jgi:hypothetical protein